MFGENPPPRMTIGTPLILKARAPEGSALFDPVRYDVTVRMPNVSLVEVSVVPFWATDVVSVYSGWAPIWYGHQTCGLVIVRPGNAPGANVTVWVVPAGTVTVCVTVIGVPMFGGVIVAVTVPVCAVVVSLVTSVFTVSAELLRSAALFSTTCALPSDSAPSTASCTGNWLPVLLSGGIWFQSTASSVKVVCGLFGLTSMASALVRVRLS